MCTAYIPAQEDSKAATDTHSTAMVLAKSESEELLASNGMDKFLSSTRPRDVLDGVTWRWSCESCDFG